MMQLINQILAAERLNLAPNTLAKWRVTGAGPKFVKIGRAVRYDPADLDVWLNTRKVQSTSEGG
jgi:predicted DNA-binding transcriptional regulator AlpA